jgi:hypothetical protein
LSAALAFALQFATGAPATVACVPITISSAARAGLADSVSPTLNAIA